WRGRVRQRQLRRRVRREWRPGRLPGRLRVPLREPVPAARPRPGRAVAAPGRAQAWRPAVPPWAHPARRSRAPGPVRRLPAPPAARAAPARPARAGAPAGRQAAAGCATSWATPEGRISDRAPGAGFVDYAGAFAPRSGDHASAPLQEAGRVDRLAVAA